MREILFRGKRADNGEWVYGYLVKVVCVTGSEWHINVNAKDPDDYHKIYIVDSETVCQFTGMTDRNGNKIFEGDICKDSLGWIFEVMWDNENARFLGHLNKERGGVYICYVGREPAVEIIGNIHDGV